MRPAAHQHAFTLMEVLAALAIVATTTYVVSSALISIARGQHVAEQLKQGPLAIRTAVARWRYTPSNQEHGYEINGWTVRISTRTDAAGELTTRWLEWSLSPAARPSLQIAFCAPVAD